MKYLTCDLCGNKNKVVREIKEHTKVVTVGADM